jgi:excisionase family DNA binding protein
VKSEQWENMPSAEHSQGEARTDGCDHPSALISAATLAERLDVSVRTVWRLLSSGKLPDPVKVGGSVRWRNADIAAWIREGCPERRAVSRRAASTATTGRVVGCR